MEKVTEFTTLKTFNCAEVMQVENAEMPTLVVSAIKNYIPMEEFKEIFTFIEEVAEKQNIQKLIFDKAKLTVFHQPSMEWYFVEWKERMFLKGLTVHRKILPTDNIFIQSVKIGRKSIEMKYPEGRYKLMDIQYCDSIEEAVVK